MARTTLRPDHAIGAMAAVAAMAIAGCQSTPSTLVDARSLAPLDASATVWPVTPGIHHLGAGDALGRDVFALYVASLVGDEMYATAEARP